MVLAVSMFFMPESPYYLVSRGLDGQAEKSLRWLRGNNYDVGRELQATKESYKEESSVGAITVSDLFNKPVYYRPFMVAMFLMFMQQFSGINVVIFYAQAIFNDAGSSIDPGMYLLYTSVRAYSTLFF